jgi:hypothetical protein
VPDRELTYRELKRLLEAHGCTVVMTRRQIVRVAIGSGATFRRWTQHAHKGVHDTFDRYTVAAARRRLGFAAMSDEEFYKPLA